MIPWEARVLWKELNRAATVMEDWIYEDALKIKDTKVGVNARLKDSRVVSQRLQFKHRISRASCKAFFVFWMALRVYRSQPNRRAVTLKIFHPTLDNHKESFRNFQALMWKRKAIIDQKGSWKIHYGKISSWAQRHGEFSPKHSMNSAAYRRNMNESAFIINRLCSNIVLRIE